MKITKALGLGLFLHVLLVAVLVIQPSCTTMQPPTQTYQQSQNMDFPITDPNDPLMQARRNDFSLDPTFNSGLDADGRFTPTRPSTEFSEFEGVTPRLSPIPDSSTVEIAGPSFKIYTVQKGDSLWAISRRQNVSLDDLYAANGLNKNSVLKIGQQIKIPADGSTAKINTISADTYQPSGYNMDSETYTVVRGDTLSGIARRFNTSVSMIKAANNKTSDKILVGEKLTIPVNGNTSGYRKPTTSNTTRSTSSTTASGSTRIHVVKAGEYPATIARQYGMTTAELLAINGITDPRSMQVGQKLKVSPNTGASTGGSKVQAPPPSVPAASAPVKNTTGDAPVAIRVVEADPLIESDLEEINPDSMFDNVEEIPVVPLEQ